MLVLSQIMCLVNEIEEFMLLLSRCKSAPTMEKFATGSAYVYSKALRLEQGRHESASTSARKIKSTCQLSANRSENGW